MLRLRVLEFDPFVSDLVLGSIKCGRILAAFLATLEFGVSSTNDNSCWFSNYMNWKPGWILLRTMKRSFQLTKPLYKSLCQSLIYGSLKLKKRLV